MNLLHRIIHQGYILSEIFNTSECIGYTEFKTTFFYLFVRLSLISVFWCVIFLTFTLSVSTSLSFSLCLYVSFSLLDKPFSICLSIYLSLSLFPFLSSSVFMSISQPVYPSPFFIYPTKLTFPSKNKDKTTFHQDLIKKRTFPSSIPLPSLCYTSITLSMYHEPHLYLLADADLLIA